MSSSPFRLIGVKKEIYDEIPHFVHNYPSHISSDPSSSSTEKINEIEEPCEYIVRQNEELVIESHNEFYDKIEEELMIHPLLDIVNDASTLECLIDSSPSSLLTPTIDGIECRSKEHDVPYVEPIHGNKPDEQIVSTDNLSIDNLNFVNEVVREIDKRLLKVGERTRLKGFLSDKQGDQMHWTNMEYRPKRTKYRISRHVHIRQLQRTLQTSARPKAKSNKPSWEQKGQDRRTLRMLDFWESNRYG